jgi:epoxide hydrolase-like predicted phosphatase
MTIRSVFVDFGGVLVRTEDPEPRRRQAVKLGMTSRDLEKIIFESESAQKASTGQILEDDHWQAVAEKLGVSRAEADQIIEQFFSGDRTDLALTEFLRSLRPEYRVCLISNAWSGLRGFITRQKFDDIFDAMIISSEVGLIKPDPHIYHLALEKLGARPAESVFIDDVAINVEAARSVGMLGIIFTQSGKVMEELEKILHDHR